MNNDLFTSLWTQKECTPEFFMTLDSFEWHISIPIEPPINIIPSS